MVTDEWRRGLREWCKKNNDVKCPDRACQRRACLNTCLRQPIQISLSRLNGCLPIKNSSIDRACVSMTSPASCCMHSTGIDVKSLFHQLRPVLVLSTLPPPRHLGIPASAFNAQQATRLASGRYKQWMQPARKSHWRLCRCTVGRWKRCCRRVLWTSPISGRYQTTRRSAHEA